MADWTHSTASGFRPYRSPWGSPVIRSFQASTCVSTATIRAGEVVTLNTVVSTGGARIVLAPSSGGAGKTEMQVGITSLIGVALESDASDGSTTGLSNEESRRISVALADPAVEFIGYLRGSGPCASSLIGQNKAIFFDSTNRIHLVDSTNSTAADAAVKITDIPSYALGDTNGPVVFKFLSSNFAL
jgi:hypothetical protein